MELFLFIQIYLAMYFDEDYHSQKDKNIKMITKHSKS